MKKNIISITYIAALVLMLAHCGDSSDTPTPVKTYSISVDVTGLVDGGDDLVLRNNAGNNLTIDSNGTYTFSKELEDEAHYNVTVLKLPELNTCTITNGSGNVDGADVKHIKVHCVS